MKKNKIHLKAKDFLNVLNNSCVLKRSPAGGRSQISKTTEILPYGKRKIEIITPFKRAILDVEGELNTNILVNAIAVEKAALALIKSKKITLTLSKDILNLSGLCEINILCVKK